MEDEKHGDFAEGEEEEGHDHREGSFAEGEAEEPAPIRRGQARRLR